MTDKTAGNPGNEAPVSAVVENSSAAIRLAFENGKQAALREDLERRAEIDLVFNNALFDRPDFQEIKRNCVDSGMTAAQAREALLAYIGKGVVPIATAPVIQRQTPATVPGGYSEYAFGRDSSIRVNAGDDQRDKFHEGASRALELRAGIVKDAAKAAEYRASNEFVGMTLVEMAKASLIRSGYDIRGLDQMQVVGAALTAQTSFVRGASGPTIGHGVSDFANLLLDASNKNMMNGWIEAPETWRPFCRVISVPDFKTVNLVNRSNFGDLDAVPENSDYKYGTFSDTKETMVIRTYGKLFSISRRAIIDDDLMAFTEVPMLMGRAAARAVGDLVYGILTSPPTLNQTGRALFHATDGNLRTTTGAGAPSVTTLDTEFTSMATKTDPSGATLNLVPRYIIVPRALEATSRVLAAATYDPAGTAGTLKPNPYNGRFDVIADARLDAFNAAGWFVAADPSQIPTIVVGFLNGVEAPYLEQVNAFTQDGVAFKVRLEAGAGAGDFRGLAYNDGVA